MRDNDVLILQERRRTGNETIRPILQYLQHGLGALVRSVLAADVRVGNPRFLKGKPQEVIDHLSKLAPLERLGQPEDIASTVAFLAGPDGAWINGQILRANGGII